MFRNIIVRSPIILGATVLQQAPSKNSSNQIKEDNLANFKCKPSDLPLYTPLFAANKPKKNECHTPRENKIRNSIESGIRTVRLEIKSGYNVLLEQKKNVEYYVSTGLEHSKSTIDYLNQPDNTFPRVGAIAIGGISGLILAIRGGFIKKIIYTGVGAGGIASLCYPKEAERFTQQGLTETKKGITIAYNFVKGVKPGEEVSIESITNFPTSLNELKDLSADWLESVKDTIFKKIN